MRAHHSHLIEHAGLRANADHLFWTIEPRVRAPAFHTLETGHREDTPKQRKTAHGHRALHFLLAHLV